MTARTLPKRNPESLTAAAQILQSRIVRATRPKSGQGMAWQNESWEYYDKVGEYSWGVDQQAWAVSQVRLVAAIDVPNQDEPEIVSGEPDDAEDAEPVSEADQIAADLVAGFAGGTSGQQQILRRVATQLLVSAESFIVGRTTPLGEEKWDAYSRDEVKYTPNGWKVDDGVDKFVLTDDDMLIRVWIPHPRRRQEPRSGSKALLPVLAEIWALTQSIAAQVDSRLAGAGMLILPMSVELVGSQNSTDETDGDGFVAEVIDMMITPIKDRESAAAIVPIIVKVPDEAVGKIQHIRFEATADLHDAEKREKAVKRLAVGMDLPSEQITGLGDMNHWSGWLVAEQTVKGPVSSLAAIIADALTVAWYRPALQSAYDEAGITDPVDDRMLWFDTTALEQRPDRSDQAQQVFDRGGLSLAALVRENGFDTDDMPDPEELLRILLFMLVKAKPELAVPLIERSGVLEQIMAAAPGAVADPVTEPPPADDDAGEVDNRELPANDPATGAGDAA